MLSYFFSRLFARQESQRRKDPAWQSAVRFRVIKVSGNQRCQEPFIDMEVSVW